MGGAAVLLTGWGEASTLPRSWESSCSTHALCARGLTCGSPPKFPEAGDIWRMAPPPLGVHWGPGWAFLHLTSFHLTKEGHFAPLSRWGPRAVESHTSWSGPACFVLNSSAGLTAVTCSPRCLPAGGVGA